MKDILSLYPNRFIVTGRVYVFHVRYAQIKDMRNHFLFNVVSKIFFLFRRKFNLFHSINA